MRIKSLFSIPDGEKVTDKALRRVLISSICSILLCMTCLVSTTWAWFTVSIENPGNVIQIAKVENTVTITDGQSKTVEPNNGVYTLNPGTYNVNVKVTSDVEEVGDLKRDKTPVYVLISVKCDCNESYQYYYFTYKNGAGDAEQKFVINCDLAELRFSVDWMAPNNATIIEMNPIVIGTKPTDPQTDESSEESTSEPTVTPTEAPTTEFTQAPTEEPTTAPTTETSTEQSQDTQEDSELPTEPSNTP